MQDPSHGVASQLQNHVHLISSHRFPLIPSLNIDQAFRYLMDGPMIVKQAAPMSWTYVTAPQDGSVWLEWIPPRNGQYSFASDGYVWVDPEQAFNRDVGGYTIECFQHSVGYRYGFEHTATHARTRYHFVSKHPGVNTAMPDPNLWIVHYHHTDQRHMMLTNAIPLHPETHRTLSQRKWLESQGRLEKREFMLHDREHWPHITIPGHTQMPQPGMYANPMLQQQQAQQMNQQRFPQYAYPAQGQQGGPPAKRARHSGPVPSDGVHEISIEEEENVTSGDYFDHLTPREISMARYMQHHRWMEEVFSSPYATSQIVPPDLGLGLMGELKGLTDGILAEPEMENVKPGAKPKEPAQPFTNLKREHVDEFTQRVEKHLRNGKDEIERLEKEHAIRMAEWKRAKTLMQAEKRLRFAAWEGQDDGQAVFRLEQGAENGDAPAENVEEIVKEVEGLLGVKIEAHKDATMVRKGGLEKEEEVRVEEEEQQDMMSMPPQQQIPQIVNVGVYQEQQQPQQQPDFGQQQQSASQATVMPQPSYQPNQPHFDQDDSAAQQPGQLDMTGGTIEHHGLDEMDMGMGDTSLMDMDVDTGDVNFIEHSPQPPHEEEEAVDAEQSFQPQEDESFLPQDEQSFEPQEEQAFQPQDEQSYQPQEQQAGESTATTDDSPHLGNEVESHVNVNMGALQSQPLSKMQQPTQEAAPANLPATTNFTQLDDSSAILAVAPNAPVDLGNELTGEPPMIGDEGDAGVNDTGLFDDTFDDLADVGGGDDMIDFGDGMGMDDSAFGDALHGMDARTPAGDGPGGGDAGS